jgi:hypothetical protein
VSQPAYDLGQLHRDLERFVFLLGGRLTSRRHAQQQNIEHHISGRNPSLE